MKKYQILGSVLIMLICLTSMFRVGYSIYPVVIILLELIMMIVIAFDESEVGILKDTVKNVCGENAELTSELEQLRQKYSRTNQPRSGGKLVTVPDKSGITRNPEIGDRYLCIKDVDMGDYIAFTAGKEYSTRINGCITNNKDNGNHIIGKNFAKLHFKLINQ